jgi:hypothetical protein
LDIRPESSALARSAQGGGLALFDPQSSINPASIGTAGAPLLFLQYEPEFRRLTSGGQTQKTTTSRFPLAVASVPITSKGTIAVSVSTLLDRSWQTTTTREETVAGDKATLTETVRSIGAINDIRLAGAWVANDFIQLGIAGHVFTGQNRLLFSQTFPDSLRFIPVSQVSNLDYTGSAVSGGVVIRPTSVFSLALSGRKGLDLNARTGDTIVSTAKIPDRYGAAISYGGIPGATVSAQVGRDLWSSLNGLGSDEARAVDAWDVGGGIETLGPKILERTILIRLGARISDSSVPRLGKRSPRALIRWRLWRPVLAQSRSVRRNSAALDRDRRMAPGRWAISTSALIP